MKSKILLQVCCAPDATVAVERLGEEYEVGVYFYNPNIHPVEEYLKRAEEMERLSTEIGVEIHMAPYDPEIWFEAVRGLQHEPEGGRRCEICFRMRLERTAKAARELGYDLFATVLTISPHKNADLINRIGEEIGKSTGIPYLPSNFKKKDGFKRSIELSRKYGLYRQDYCGCLFSKQRHHKREER